MTLELADPDVAERASYANGCGPTEMVSTTAFVAGSILQIVPSPSFRIHSRPSGPRTPSEGDVPTFVVATITPVVASSRVTERALLWETHTPSSCGSTQTSPPRPTWITATALVAGLMRYTSSPYCEPTQIAPAPARMHVRVAAVWILFTTFSVRGLMRETVPAPESDDHTDPKP